MAVGSSIAVTPGSGAKIATGPTYTENSNTVQDQKVIEGEPYAATYTLAGVGPVSIATTNSHILQIMAGASLNVRILRIELWQNAAAGTAAISQFGLIRLTSAGTGGGVQTPAAMDTTDTVGATAMTLPSAKGAESGQPLAWSAPNILQTIGASLVVGPLFVWDFERLRSKPPTIAAGTANGVAIKCFTGVASATVYPVVFFKELPF